jgi:hypothetical protein
MKSLMENVNKLELTKTGIVLTGTNSFDQVTDEITLEKLGLGEEETSFSLLSNIIETHYDVLKKRLRYKSKVMDELEKDMKICFEELFGYEVEIK